MSFAKRNPKHQWRLFLTSDEAADLEVLEREAEKIDARRRQITAATTVIRNRCLQRALADQRRREREAAA